MKITRRQLRSIIKETIEPKSFAEKIASMIESGDSSNVMLALNFIQSGIFEDVSEDSPKPIHKEYRIKTTKNENISLLVNSILSDNNKVKKAIILKEIFDKPRAIRRSIR